MEICCICHKKLNGGKTFQLTEDERDLLSQSPKEVYYCPPCLKVMQDREAGAQLLKGLYEMKLKELGVPHAREASLKLLELLVGDKKS